MYTYIYILTVSSSKNPCDIFTTLNADLGALSPWADQWKVTFNPSKSFYLHVSNKKHKAILDDIYLCNIPIHKAEQIPMLGVTLTESLKWDSHIEKIISKASKRLYIIRRHSHYLPRIALERLYLSMIRPVLEYGDVLYDNCSLNLGQSLERVQRQAALLCTRAYRHTEYVTLLKELNWETLCSRRKTHKLLLFYKIKNHIYPSYLNNLLPEIQPIPYSLRNHLANIPRFARLTVSFNSFIPHTARLWNSLSENTRLSPTLNIFKAKIRGPDLFNPYYRMCSNKSGSWLARLRMNLSALNSHRFTYNFIDSPLCANGFEVVEATEHYLLDCISYRLARAKLLRKLDIDLGIVTTDRERLIKIILFGESVQMKNLHILYKIVLNYLNETKRFK